MTTVGVLHTQVHTYLLPAAMTPLHSIFCFSLQRWINGSSHGNEAALQPNNSFTLGVLRATLSSLGLYAAPADKVGTRFQLNFNFVLTPSPYLTCVLMNVCCPAVSHQVGNWDVNSILDFDCIRTTPRRSAAAKTIHHLFPIICVIQL